MDVPVYKFALTSELSSACADHETLSVEDFLPTRSEPEASGWDVRCADPNGISLRGGVYYRIPLGFRAFCPPGWWAELNPRSSSFLKRHLHSLYGKIDETYPDQWFFLCQYLPDASAIINNNNPKRVEFGDRIGQVMPVRRQDMGVEIISNEEMNEEIKNRDAARKGGLGSTGIN
tara:strand:+ start:341 stop:865 length:525 start_codon:yes stop_codon:yes gene_type:complete